LKALQKNILFQPPKNHFKALINKVEVGKISMKNDSTISRKIKNDKINQF